MRQPSRFSEAGFESMKLGAFLLFGRTKRPDLHRTSPPAFFAAFRWQLGARNRLDVVLAARGVGQLLAQLADKDVDDLDLRRLYLQAAQEAGQRLERQGLHRDGFEHRAASGKRRKTPAGWSGEGQAVLCVQTAKKPPSFIDSKPTSGNREGCRMTYAITWAEWVEHADASIRPHAA